jgi:hypothetical protein
VLHGILIVTSSPDECLQQQQFRRVDRHGTEFRRQGDRSTVRGHAAFKECNVVNEFCLYRMASTCVGRINDKAVGGPPLPLDWGFAGEIDSYVIRPAEILVVFNFRLAVEGFAQDYEGPSTVGNE